MILFGWVLAIDILQASFLQTPRSKGGYGFTTLQNGYFKVNVSQPSFNANKSHQSHFLSGQAGLQQKLSVMLSTTDYLYGFAAVSRKVSGSQNSVSTPLVYL